LVEEGFQDRYRETGMRLLRTVSELLMWTFGRLSIDADSE
jgi:hypothetical protein